MTSFKDPEQLELDPDMSSIIVFGKSHAGKSSLVNMLARTNVAPIKNSLGGRVFDHRSYEVTLKMPQEGHERKFRVWEILGLEDHTEFPLPAASLQSLEDIMQKATKGRGIALLIFCVWSGRQSRVFGDNIDLFWGLLCKKQVPLMVVVTGLEGRDNMGSWWDANQVALNAFGLPSGDIKHACITTTKGKPVRNGSGYVYDKEYQDSQDMVLDMVVGSIKGAWKAEEDGVGWQKQVEDFITTTFLDETVQRTKFCGCPIQ